MRNGSASLFIAVVIFFGCATNNAGSNTSDSSLASNSNSAPPASAVPSSAVNNSGQLAGRWTLIPAMASDTATGKIPFLAFDIGRVSGNTGCNSFSGSYQSNGASLSFANDMVTTRMACAGYDEAAFVKSLMRTNSYDIKGDTLVLKADVTPLSYWLKGKQ